MKETNSSTSTGASPIMVNEFDNVDERLARAAKNVAAALESQFSPKHKVDSTAFEIAGRSSPPLSLSLYVSRLATHSGVGPAFLVYTYIYVMRAQRQKGVRLDAQTSFKLLAAASIAAIKFYDNYYNRKLHNFSKLVGLNFWKVRDLEISFNNLMDYDFWVEPADFYATIDFLAHYDPAVEPPVPVVSDPIVVYPAPQLYVSPKQQPIAIGQGNQYIAPEPLEKLQAPDRSRCGETSQQSLVSLITANSLTSQPEEPTTQQQPESSQTSAASSAEPSEQYSNACDDDDDDVFCGGLEMSPGRLSDASDVRVDDPLHTAPSDASEALFSALAVSAAKLSLGHRASANALGHAPWESSCRAASKLQHTFSGFQNAASSGQSGGSSLIAAFYSSQGRRRVTWQ